MKTMTAPMGWNSWDCYGAAVTEDIVRKNADFMAKHLKKYGWEYITVDIQGYDIDGDVVKAARENAKRAGVDHLIHFQQRPVAELHHPKKYGFIVTNPPYGERLEDKADLPELYSQIGEAYRRLDAWSMYLITSYEDTERYIGRKADKNRKIYNGMLKTYFYQFMGPKPPKRDNFH